MAKEQKQEEEISLKVLIEKGNDWFTYLFIQWKIIMLAAVLGATIGLVYSFIKKPIYMATLSFALEDEKGGGGLSGALGLASSLGFDFGTSGGGMFNSSNLIELFKSRKMVEETLLTPVNYEGKKISLAEMYIQNKQWRERWEEKPKLMAIQFLPGINRKYYTRVQDSILGVIYKNLSNSGLTVAQKDKKISIINIDVSATNELFSKYFAEALAKHVSDFYIATKSKKARINMKILEKQTDSIRGELNSAITGVAVANDNTFGLNPSLNVRRVPSARRQVDVQANTAILTELVKQLELAKVTLRRETPLIQIIDSPILPLKVEKVGKLKGIIIGGFLVELMLIIVLIAKRIFL